MKIANGPIQSGNNYVRKICNCTNFGTYWLILCPMSYLGGLNQEELVFIGLDYQGKDIMFRFVIEYSSLMDFGP
jgi:hypothetical protein